jgi:PTS system ascorbate-specific IIB component
MEFLKKVYYNDFAYIVLVKESSKMVSILACCANGSGTSLMMRLTLDKVISSCGFKVEEVRHDSIAEGKKIAHRYDIVLCPLNFVDMFADAVAQGSKVIGLKNVMAQKEMTEALENCGIDLRQ